MLPQICNQGDFEKTYTAYIKPASDKNMYPNFLHFCKIQVLPIIKLSRRLHLIYNSTPMAKMHT